MTDVKNGLDSLSDDELIRLRVAFRRLLDTIPTSGMRAICACINEVDARLSDRGVLDLRTGKLKK